MDAYLVLTPLLVLGIIALIRFIGCNWVFGLEPTVAEVKPVDALQGVTADRRVTLSWTYLSTENITGFRVDVTGGPFDQVMPPGIAARSAEITGLTNGVTYTFSVFAEREPYASEPATIMRTPGVTSFVIDEPAITGSPRNDYSGFAGMEIMVGPDPITVTQLGRIVVASNSGIHEVKIVRPATTPVPGQPVAGIDEISVSVPTIAQVDQSNVGKFAWAALPQPVTLQPNTIYFVVSAEIAAGDLWYEEQPVPTTAVAALQFATFTLPTGPDAGKYQRNSAGRVYVPVSFRY
jgi:hypothetical protein